jgi:hypothetical protein
VQGTEGGTTSTTVNRSTVNTSRVTSQVTEYLSPIIRDQGKRITSTSSSSQNVGSQTVGVNGRGYGYGRLGQIVSTSNVNTGSSTFDTFLRESYELASDKKVGEYLVYQNTTFDKTVVTANGVELSPDAIVVGDADAIASYVAQGNREVTIDATDYYWDNYEQHNVRQQIYNEYDDYNRHTTYYYMTYKYKITYYSPIVLNMDGTGKLMASNGEWRPHETFHKDRMAIFDFYGSGQPMLMEWVGPKDGLLCVPKADGSVDGTSFFGTANGYADGYDELSQTRDLNDDGVVSGAELEGLFVWQDGNGNGIAGPTELKSVQELGITEISTRHTNFKSTFKMNGKTFTAWDWWPNFKAMVRMQPPAGM